MVDVEDNEDSLSNRAKLAEEDLEGKMKIRLQDLDLGIKELERQEKNAKISLDKLKANIGSRATPVEWIMGIGVAYTAFSCVFMLLCAFCRFRELLLRLAQAKPVAWTEAYGIGRVHSGQISLAQVEWPASALAWAAGLGFVALAAAIAVVAVGASVALSRIRRE
jgi:hypothetical protein